MEYHTILFDLDGTLLNTLEDLRGAVNHQLSVSGLPQRSLAEVRQFVGNGLRNLMRLSLPEGCSDEEIDRHTAAMRSWYNTHDRVCTRPYDGILPLLRQLREAGCAVAVVSNKVDEAVKDLCAHYFGDLVAIAVGETEGLRRKPWPDTVELALRQLGAGKEGAVYIGDSEVDLATARNAGLPCISVTWGFRTRKELEEAGAVTFADSPEELWKLLQKS